MNRSNYQSASVQGAANLPVVAAATVAASTSNYLSQRFVHSVYAANRNAAARYIWVSLASAGGAVFGGLVIEIPAGGATLIDSTTLGQGGLSCGGNNPIYVSVSTSSTTFAAGTDADHDITLYWSAA